MSPKRERVDFVDFLRDAEKDPHFLGQFLSIKTANELYNFFRGERGPGKKEGKKYLDIPFNDCKEILQIFKKAVKKRTVLREGKRVKVCVGGQKEY